MKTDSYSKEIMVTSTVSAAYKALTTQFDKWRTSRQQPNTFCGDITTFTFEPSYWKMKATKLKFEESVEYECVKAYHLHEGLPDSIVKEWQYTRLLWSDYDGQ